MFAWFCAQRFGLRRSVRLFVVQDGCFNAAGTLVRMGILCLFVFAALFFPLRFVLSCGANFAVHVDEVYAFMNVCDCIAGCCMAIQG